MRRTGKAKRTSSCTGKKPMTRDEAKKAADWWRRVRQARMQAYRCRFCRLPDGSKAWHIGNRRPR